ncbi:MAG TPA: carbohydrate-binding family 6 protein [Opitutaceae bacterium]|jgi:hypothetical protein
MIETRNYLLHRWAVGLWSALFSGFAAANAAVLVRLPTDAPAPLRFAADAISQAAETAAPAPGAADRWDITLEILPSGSAQSYQIARTGNVIRVVGADATGAMYGGLDVADALHQGSVASLRLGEHRPYIAERGIKFNLPLDLRTPSYSDDSDSAQANIPEVWSLGFWREYFDEMARDRFNALSLWNLNPFPSIVKVPEFPDVALNDVLRGQRHWFEGGLPLTGIGKFKPEMLAGAETIRRMSIDEKIAFWRDVLRLAHDRGIAVYWYTWNAFVFSEEGKDGITRQDPNGRMAQYFRDSVRETVKTYPLLAGIGITAGENLGDLPGPAKEQWLWRTYGEGIRDALRGKPPRTFRLIHRLHETDLRSIRSEWAEYPSTFDVSFKYAVAHLYGVPNPPYIQPLLPKLSRTCRTWLELRDDDIYSFRWGDPDYVRAFVQAIPGPDKVIGFNLGPDGYCWGREAMAWRGSQPRPLVMQKQWLSFQLWGRLSYDPTLPNSWFEREVGSRFPEVSEPALDQAWVAASRIIPNVNRFIWMPLDFQWLPEACSSNPKFKGFYSVRDFMNGTGMPNGGDLSIRAWRRARLAHQPTEGRTPFEVSAQLRHDAGAALAGVTTLCRRAASNRELADTLDDIEAMAWLGRYYADKIDGAAELALYDATSQREQQQSAVAHLERARDDWREYAAAYCRQYRQPLLYCRVGVIDLPQLTAKAQADVEMARGWTPGSVSNLAPSAFKHE